MKRNALGWRRLAPPTRQGRVLVIVGGILTFSTCVLHVFMGANLLVILVAGFALILSIYPLALYGVFNIGALLVALVGFRHIGFPIFAKLAMGQPLDSNLTDPLGAFGVALMGVAAYLISLLMASELRLGRPLLRPMNERLSLARISSLAALIGIGSNLAVAFRVAERGSGITVASFFTTFLHLALITAIVRSLRASKGRSSVDVWVVMLVAAEIAFAIGRNSRMALMETFLAFIVTVAVFKTHFQWRQFVLTAVAIALMVTFLTPVFLHVRTFRGDLTWAERINSTLDAAIRWPDTLESYLEYTQRVDRSEWYLNYYGSHQNVFERMSLVNHVDILKAGVDGRGKVGWKDLRLSLQRAMPRLIAPSKPLGYSQGFWLYESIGIPNPGPYATAPLIGTGYAAFGWAGAFFYPLLLSLIWLLMVKKISGLNLQGNIWAIYLLLRIHDQFVEGSSDAYLLYVLRMLPQDLVVLWLMEAVARGRLLLPGRRIVRRVHGK